MYIRLPLYIFALCAFINTAFAVNIYECVYPNGERAFEDHCPPGTTRIDEKSYTTSTPTGNTSTAAPVTLYSVPGCDTCEQMKEFLNIRNVNYTEKDVSESVEMQEELNGVAGELRVPVLVIGNDVLRGYNRSALIQSLSESGHIAQQ